MDRRSLVALVLLVALAGCGGFSASAPSASTPTAVGSAGPIPQDTVSVSVTAVVDGDTIRVAYPNGTVDTVRLVGVDTPEVHVENDPAEFEGVPDTDAGRACLREAGTDASNFAKDALLGREVGLAFDPATDRRGYYDRLLAYVVVEDRLFNYRLVATGHAGSTTATSRGRTGSTAPRRRPARTVAASGAVSTRQRRGRRWPTAGRSRPARPAWR